MSLQTFCLRALASRGVWDVLAGEEKGFRRCLLEAPLQVSIIPPRCKHTCEEHSATYPLRCKKCSCLDFTSNFACLTCDGPWEDHEVVYEMGEERKMMGKKVGEEYMPLASHQHIQK